MKIKEERAARKPNRLLAALAIMFIICMFVSGCTDVTRSGHSCDDADIDSFADLWDDEDMQADASDAAPVRLAETTTEPTDAPEPTVTPAPTPTPKPTDTPKPTATPTPKPTNTPKPTATPTPKPTRTPKPTATPTPKPTRTPKPTATPKPSNSSGSYDYVLNTNTMKFHRPTCRDVGRIKPENRENYKGTRASLIAMGYSPCGHCHP